MHVSRHFYWTFSGDAWWQCLDAECQSNFITIHMELMIDRGRFHTWLFLVNVFWDISPTTLVDPRGSAPGAFPPKGLNSLVLTYKFSEHSQIGSSYGKSWIRRLVYLRIRIVYTLCKLEIIFECTSKLIFIIRDYWYL